MEAFEGRIARAAAHVVTVSPVDAALMRKMFGVTRISEVPTGVDVESFTPPPESDPAADLIFVGAMDWLPNMDGMRYFAAEILPLIRRRAPRCSVAMVGRSPGPEMRALGEMHGITVTGTVPDVRPYLWGGKVCIVPLRIGGGTRLKIYEAMAAGIPVVSTTIGGEGLAVEHGVNIRLADTPQAFAEECIALLENASDARRMAAAAREMVCARFSWDRVAGVFEGVLEGLSGNAR